MWTRTDRVLQQALEDRGKDRDRDRDAGDGRPYDDQARSVIRFRDGIQQGHEAGVKNGNHDPAIPDVFQCPDGRI